MSAVRIFPVFCFCALLHLFQCCKLMCKFLSLIVHAQWELVFLHITFACFSAPSAVREFSLLFLPLAWCCKEATIISFNVASSVTFLGFDFWMFNRYWASYTFPFAVATVSAVREFSPLHFCAVWRSVLLPLLSFEFECASGIRVLALSFPYCNFCCHCLSLVLSAQQWALILWVWFFLCVFLPIERRYQRLRRLRKPSRFLFFEISGYSPHILILQNLESSIVKSFIGSEGFLAR